MKPLYCSKGHENPNGTRFCQYCGEKLTLPENNGINPGAILGDRYRIERQLGQGGFGRTYLAVDLNRFNELCVLKEFAPQVQGAYALEKASELFEREAGVLYKLQHPQIPHFRELFRVNQEGIERLFLVQDYVEGQTYRALLNARKLQGLRFNEVEVTQMLLQILPVLEYIHNYGVIHRDISPDNLILRSSDGLPVLIDFGGVKQVAATVQSQLIQPGNNGGTAALPTRLGKVGYAPHEQIQRGIVAPHSDFYALAVTVLVLLTGKEPDSLIDHQTLSWNWRREVSLSPTLGAVLDKMLAQWPGDRYQSAPEVLQALTHNPPPVYHPPAPAPVTPPPVYHPPAPAPAPPPPVYHPPAPAPAPPPPVYQPPTEATRAVAPAPKPAPAPTPSPYVSQPRGLSGSGITLLVLGLIIGAGGIGWLVGNLLVLNRPPQSITPTTEPTQSPSSPPPVTPKEPSPPPLSAQEQQRLAALRQRRTALGMDDDFYNNLVNEAFWTQNPSLRGRRLSNAREDEQLREGRDKVADQLLDKIEQTNLSQEARSRLGRYGKADRDRWKESANKLHVSSRTLYDLADGSFFHIFPQQPRDENFINKPIGQVWQAIAADKLKAMQSGSALETIRFAPEATEKQVSGTLKPGAGKAYIAQLSAGQLMDLKLKAGKDTLLSVYSPSGKTRILEDSKERSWAGTLPESGYYEIVVISNAREAIDYQLDLTVNNPPSPASPPPSDSSTTSPSPSTTDKVP